MIQRLEKATIATLAAKVNELVDIENARGEARAYVEATSTPLPSEERDEMIFKTPPRPNKDALADEEREQLAET